MSRASSSCNDLSSVSVSFFITVYNASVETGNDINDNQLKKWRIEKHIGGILAA